MGSDTTRRGFLWKSAAAGGGAVLGNLAGMQGAARGEERSVETPAPGTLPAGNSPRVAGNAPLVVVTQAVCRDTDPRAGAWPYIAEILGHAGLFFEEVSSAQLPQRLRRSAAIVLLAGNLQLAAAEREALAGLVRGGGTLIGIGGTSALDEVFGVQGTAPLAEGWIVSTAEDHPLTTALRSSLHVFGGCIARPGAARALAELEGSTSRAPRGGAILEHQFGQGRSILLGPDLIFSILHIQQGLPVFQDGPPAPDGSAPLDDGILKAEDGLVLDWQRDRTPMQPDGTPAFLEPVSDELREIILRAVFYAARQQDVALPMLWYWPRGLKAVGHISHDSDGNDPQRAEALLEVMNRCQVKSTWCIIYPGGYPRAFYDALEEQGHEIALHYDAHTVGPHTSWSKENMALQHRWLLKEAGLEEIVSNKNHYTRWESRLDYFRWCEALGIRSDQTRGPSKRGTIGFPLGGSQPFFPLDDQADPPRFLDVLEVNMLTQDLVIVCPAEYGRELLDSAVRHHGVAHFLFHPAHILTAGVAEALTDLVEYGRSQGIAWWTGEQIDRWERQRRGLQAQFGAEAALTLSATAPLHEATLLVLNPPQGRRSLTINNNSAKSDLWNVYGFEFESVTVDLVGEVAVRCE